MDGLDGTTVSILTWAGSISDMSYELWAGDGDGDGGWRVPVSPQPCPGHGVYLCIDHVFV